MPTNVIKFPCDFPVKIIGEANSRLHEEVTKMLTEHVPEFVASDLTLNTSKGGKYYALTAVIHAKSKEQLDGIYQALTAHNLVLMAL